MDLPFPKHEKYFLNAEQEQTVVDGACPFCEPDEDDCAIELQITNLAPPQDGWFYLDCPKCKAEFWHRGDEAGCLLLPKDRENELWKEHDRAYEELLPKLRIEILGNVAYDSLGGHVFHWLYVSGTRHPGHAYRFAWEQGWGAQRCIHSYDCCGNFYKDAPIVSQDIGISGGVVLISKAYQNV